MMIEQRNNFLWFKLNAIMRYFLVHWATNIIPLYVVNEYPKSGGSWVGEMLSDALDVPFPRNRLPMLRPSILHGHMMQLWNVHNALIVWRDGRDVLISQYFHSLFENERGNARLVSKCRADLDFADYEDVEENLIPFMEYVYEQKRHPKMSWAEFVDRWADCEKCVHVRYEDLRVNPDEELGRIVTQLTGKEMDEEQVKAIVIKHSFEKLSGRKTGIEDQKSFLRKGIVGDWKNYFNRAARERFYRYAGSALIRLGYEADKSWVSERIP